MIDDVPPGTNKYPTLCKTCGAMIAPGQGILYKRGGKRTYFQGKWLIEHDDCPGAKPKDTTNAGWVYALTSVGPDASWTKVGMTGGSIGDRILAQIGTKYMPCGLNLARNQVWAAPTAARYEAEASAHQILLGYRIHPSHKLGRELFQADLPTVLQALKSATDSDPKRFEWDLSNWYLALEDDPFPQEDRGILCGIPDERIPNTKRVVRGRVA